MRNTSHSGSTARRIACAGAAVLFLLLVLPSAGQAPDCGIEWGVRDTHVRAWFPTESYDSEPRMWIRTGADFAFISLEQPSSSIALSVVSRTSANPITIVAHRLKEPFPPGMTYSIWKEIRDDMFDGMLDQVYVDDVGRFSLNTYGARHIMLEAQGASVGYALESSDGWSDKPTWCQEPTTPTPIVSPSPDVTPTLGSPITRIEVPAEVSSVLLEYAIIADEYEPGTCFEIASEQDKNGRSTAPDFLAVIHSQGVVYRWKFQRFENGAVYMSPSGRPCDVGVEYLR